MIRFLLLSALLAPLVAQAQIYRWVDSSGRVHYGNAAPPPGSAAKLISAESKPGQESPDARECYSLRCQGERMELRLARREELEARLAAERAAAAPKPPRGLDFRRYIGLQRGMSEGELLARAGEPDHYSRGGSAIRTYTYLPTVADPFVTTVTLVGGRIWEIERVAKF